MAQMIGAHCDCCGQAVDLARFELCPVCQYPVDPTREEQFLENALSDLQRVARYGGASLRVLDLIRRYEGRLHFLTSRRSIPTPQASEASARAQNPMRVLAEPSAVEELAKGEFIAPESVESFEPAQGSTQEPVVSAVFSPPAMSVKPAGSLRGFAFSGDAMVNVLAAVGGFLILAGVLGTVFVTPSLWLAFGLVFGVHSAFGVASLVTRRSTLLRAVSPLYTLIFALLVPLLAFSAYRLVEQNMVALSPAYVLALSALYAAVIYGVLAVVQRFVPFAYLGITALLIGDLALAQALHLSYWWWPSSVLGLAFLTLVALPRATGRDLLAEQRAILRTPLLLLMYTIVVGVSFVGPCMLVQSLVLDGLPLSNGATLEPHIALLVLSCLSCFWYALWLWRTRQVLRTPLLGYLCLATCFLFGYVLRFDLLGYALLEVMVALLYHGAVRVARQRLDRYGFPRNTLDGLAFALTMLVLLQMAAALPFQLIYATFTGPSATGRGVSLTSLLSSLRFTPDPHEIWHLFALGLCLLVVLDMALARAGMSKIPSRANWCWLLLPGGLIVCALYGLEVLLWQVYPFGAFVVLSLGLLCGAVLTRRILSSAWAYPLEVLTWLVLAFTLLLSLSQPQNTISELLLSFAVLLCGMALYQKRPRLALFTATFLLLALLSLRNHPSMLLGLGLLLPLLAAGLSRADAWKGITQEAKALFVWSLLVPALFYGLWLAWTDIVVTSGIITTWANTHQLPVPMLTAWLSLHSTGVYELALAGLVWYAAAVLARVRLCLIPATLFWLFAIAQPGVGFWALAMLTPALALVGVMSEKRSRQVVWAWPWYLVALWGSVTVIGVPLEQSMWCLFGYALLAYGLGVASGHRTLFLFTVLYSGVALYFAAGLFGNLYLPPAVVLVGVGLGLGAGRVARQYQRSAMQYALPFYASALVAAILTGVYGMLGNLNLPFYGAVVDALWLYALVASIVVWRERRPFWNWLVALFACWGVLLAQRLSVWYILDAGVSLALVGLLGEWLVKRALRTREAAQLASFASAQLAQPSDRRAWPASDSERTSWLWTWPWYSAFLVAAVVLGCWPATMGVAPSTPPLVQGMTLLTLLAVVIMLVRRAPELVVFPLVLACWTVYLWQFGVGPVPLIVAYTVLCALIYGAQFVWRLWPAFTRKFAVSSLYTSIALGGLCLVLLYALSQGALSSNAGMLAQAGILALVILSVVLCCHGWFHPAQVRRGLPETLDPALYEARMTAARALGHRCFYSAGLLLSLAISWELLAYGQTRFDALTLAPASYLIVIAPLLLRDPALARHHLAGQWAALLGSALLLLPSLWYSFQGAVLAPTLILQGEAFLLLLLGLLLRMRVFILSSAALIIIGTLRLLFISMPPSVPILLVVFGGLLMALATALILSRHRLQTAWSHWE